MTVFVGALLFFAGVVSGAAVVVAIWNLNE
jgi:hypothetical protein